MSSKHYVTLDDGTVWPVNVGEIEWQLRYGTPSKSELLIAASVLNLYESMTDPSLRASEAETKLGRARLAHRKAEA